MKEAIRNLLRKEKLTKERHSISSVSSVLTYNILIPRNGSLEFRSWKSKLEVETRAIDATTRQGAAGK